MSAKTRQQDAIVWAEAQLADALEEAGKLSGLQRRAAIQFYSDLRALVSRCTERLPFLPA